MSARNRLRCGAALLLLGGVAVAQSPKYGVGRPPAPSEIAAWDITIPPDGKGLPSGRGRVAEGRRIYETECSRCHGQKGEGGDSVALAGGIGSLKSAKPLKTVGSFWPYVTTVWDYINRAMPFDRPSQLSHDQVYAVTAYVLHLNGILGENDALDAESLPQVKMPNRDGFRPDPRPDTGASANRAAGTGEKKQGK